MMNRERKRTLKLVEIESDTYGGKKPYGLNVYQHAEGRFIDDVLATVDEEGVFCNRNGRYFGTVQKLYYEPVGEVQFRNQRLTLTYPEFLELGRPRKFLETTTYEPIIDDPLEKH